VPLLRLIAIATLLLVALPAAAQDDVPTLFEELNELEQADVLAAIERLGLSLDATPEGKRFGEVHIVCLDVFDESFFLSFLNALHSTTRPDIVVDELLFEPGDGYDDDIVRETMRNLRVRENFSVVGLVPVESALPGRVDILAVTRDVWSLRVEGDYSIVDGVVDMLFIQGIEQNLAGRHIQLGVATVYEQDTFQIGPIFRYPRVAGSRFNLSEDLRFVANHRDGGLEGVIHFAQLEQPLYSLGSEWGVRVAEFIDYSVDRLFLGAEIRTYDNPDTDVVEAVPIEVEQREVEYAVEGMRRFGDRFKHDVTFGHGFASRNYALVPETDPETLAAFERDFLPRSERASMLLLSHTWFEASYRTLFSYDTYGFSEDIRIGPIVRTEMRAAPVALGSSSDFIEASVLAGYVLSDTRWVADVAVETGLRWQIADAELIDRYVSVGSHFATPNWGPLRIHVGGGGTVRWDRVTEAPSTLGGDNGLRGYPSGAFLGESVLLGHVEARLGPLFTLLGVHVGLVAFFDAGTVYDEGETGTLLSDVGLGVRAVSPQAQRLPFRVDWAFPTSGPSELFPGTLTFGLGQVF